MRTIIGTSLLLSPFMALAIFIMATSGALATVVVFGVTAAVVGIVLTGTWLLTDGLR